MALKGLANDCSPALVAVLEHRVKFCLFYWRFIRCVKDETLTSHWRDAEIVL